MPKLSKLKNKAMLVDLIISKEYVRRTHKTGINVLYANGSGQWVDIKAYVGDVSLGQATTWSERWVWEKWRQIKEAGAFPGGADFNDYFLVEGDYWGGATSNPAPAPGLLPVGVWANLDRASGSSVK
jgi:hypothetical protein